MSRPQNVESATGDPRLATRLPALREILAEQRDVATAAVTSILTSRIDREDEMAVRARDAALVALAVIDAALDRIDHGRYGICGAVRWSDRRRAPRRPPHGRPVYRLPVAKGKP